MVGPSSSSSQQASSSAYGNGGGVGPWKRPLTEADDERELENTHTDNSKQSSSATPIIGSSSSSQFRQLPSTHSQQQHYSAASQPAATLATRRAGPSAESSSSAAAFGYTLPLPRPIPLHSLLETQQLSPGPTTTQEVRESYLRTLSSQHDGHEEEQSRTAATTSSKDHGGGGGRGPVASRGSRQSNLASTSGVAHDEPTPLSGSLFDFEKFMPAASEAEAEAEQSAVNDKGKRPIRSVTPPPAPARTLCLRHSMMANHEASEKLQQVSREPLSCANSLFD